jgi:CheY-like chemotaxis protein
MKSGKLILLIDDDPITNYLNSHLIKSLSVAEEIKIFLNGKDALDYLIIINQTNGQIPDLILLDINMQVLDGFDFLNAFHALNLSFKDKIKIIMMSISLNLEITQKVKLAGYDAIEKPLTAEKIIEFLTRNTSGMP